MLSRAGFSLESLTEKEFASKLTQVTGRIHFLDIISPRSLAFYELLLMVTGHLSSQKALPASGGFWTFLAT